MTLPRGLYADAIAEQGRLREMARFGPLPPNPRFVAGADVSSEWRGNTLWGGIVVCDSEAAWEAVDSSVARQEATFPYIPGLLGFREAPVLAEAFKGLRVLPDVLLVDAQGTAHPRRFGSACHVGVTIGVPTVGCAKSHLCGDYSNPSIERGSWSPLLLEGKAVGAALRTRAGVAPLFVSPGHLSDLPTSIALVLRCCPRFRIPEPIRKAHAAANEARRRDAR